MLTELRLRPGPLLLTRCAACNELLDRVAKETVRDRVPAYVWQTREEFCRCPECRRVYWGATHKARVMEELEQLKLPDVKDEE